MQVEQSRKSRPTLVAWLIHVMVAAWATGQSRRLSPEVVLRPADKPTVK
jgi:hypothetical protein